MRMTLKAGMLLLVLTLLVVIEAQTRMVGPRNLAQAKGKLSQIMKDQFRQGLSTISVDDLQRIVDGTNAVYEGFQRSRKWFSKLKKSIKSDKHEDILRNSTAAEILQMEIEECFPVQSGDRCFSPCRLSRNRKYKFCWLDSAEDEWHYCTCQLKEDVLNFLQAAKNDYLAPVVEPWMTPTEIGLTIGLSLTGFSLVISLVVCATNHRRQRMNRAAQVPEVLAQRMPMVPQPHPANPQVGPAPV